ncbi:E3 ubiquitin-protein ligase RHF2A-like [Impatiens glandulifera]|uniref:E3 ubiquitin-protein ligase RHF2A-like n=1 Tax=Impatiens glandulifera TaxID=253017 RepID=UPI001FB05361|nr:E3 ubiquitin-protein ligase RHF2A-like [Impatiens glandulifera]
MDDDEGKSDDDVHHHLTSAAAFVEGGIQEACDDACSICLESFCDTDPSTVTSCKHEFHLQCILEWCQRSSQCPMCWQLISLKDPSSQELLDAVEHEKNIRLNPPTRNTTIFRHPTLGDFELQHLPGSATTGSELEERIIQHLAAAAAMGSRTHHVARRELGHERGSDDHGVHPHFLVFSTHPNTPPTQIGEDELDPSASVAITALPSSVSTQDSVAASASGSTSITTSHHGSSSSNSSNNHQYPNHQEKAGPSDLQSISEAIRSRFNTLTMRYKESITKGTRGWKDRLLSRNTNNSEVRKVGGMNEGTTSGAAAAVSGQTDNSITDSVDNHQLMEPI